MKRNKEQLKAINTINKNIVVSASAGAGKTTILIDRLIKRIVKDKISLTEIIALTFTEAAASEMKKRLINKLYETIKDPTLSKKELAFVNKQLSLVNTSLITTIHSFCLTIVKSNFALLNIKYDSINNIIEDHTKQLFLNQALEKVIVKNIEEIQNLFSYTLEKINTSNLTIIINNIINNILNKTDPLKMIDNYLSLTNQITEIKDLPKIYLDDYLKLIIDKIKLSLKELNSLKILKKDKVNINIIEEIEKLLESCLTCKDIEYIINKVTNINIYQQEIKANPFTNFRNKLKDVVIHFINVDNFIQDYNDNAKNKRIILNLAKQVYLEFIEIKKINSVLDFNDFEHFALKILKLNNNEIANRYKEKLKEIMIDEFQDTNETQNTIINLISKDNNSFKVGDVKQSVYLFRGARPKLMQDLTKNPTIENIILHNNYRSKKTIVNFNNTIYKKLMNIEGLSGNFTKQDEQIADLPSQQEENYNIKIHIANLEKPIQPEGYYTSEIVAKDIINNIKNTKFKNYSDFCVLVSSNSEKTIIKKTFENYNIPYFIEDTSGYINSYSIEIILSYLKILININDRISLVSVLTSPLYNIKNDDLLLLKDSNYQDEKIFNKYNLLTDINKIKENNNILNIFNSIIQIQDFYSNHTTKQQRTNIDYFYKIIIDNNLKTIQQVIEYIETSPKTNVFSPLYINNEDNVVRVMTIHKSKGLQFNVVYLISKGRMKKPNLLPINLSEDYGLSLNIYNKKNKSYYPSFIDQLINEKTDYDLGEEYLRRLYVATTRPVYQLNIVGFNSTDVILDLDSIKSQTKFSDLILSSIDNCLDIVDIINYNDFDKPKPSIESKNIKNTNITPKYDNSKLLIKEKKKLNAFAINPLFKTSATDKGTLIHKTIEKLDNNKEWTNEYILSISKELSQENITNILDLKNNELYRLAVSKEHYFEFSYSHYIDNTLKNKFIDFISFDTDKIIIIDFKTGGKDKNEDYFIKEYKEQLLDYKNSITKFYNKKVYAYIYSFSLKKMIEIE